MSGEIDFEPIPGLPEELPAGERIVWQGRPAWRALARQTFKVRWLGAYFAVFVGARAVVAMDRHEGLGAAGPVLASALLGAACLAIMTVLAWLYARSTVYTITTRRVVMRIGVALPMAWNLPFKRLASADLVTRKEGDGDIVLALAPPSRIGWLHLWPHVAPWRYVKARPTFRAIAEPARVAKLLREAVEAWAAHEAAPVAIAEGAARADEAETNAPTPLSVRRDLATEAAP